MAQSVTRRRVRPLLIGSAIRYAPSEHFIAVFLLIWSFGRASLLCSLGAGAFLFVMGAKKLSQGEREEREEREREGISSEWLFIV